ncbi:MAG: zinc dependent phospholipase C family protein [Eubacteriales bacterium]
MATWLTHLRVADAVSDFTDIKNKTLFFAGSIAPDSGMSADITHWCVGGDKCNCDAQGFFHKYLFKLDNFHSDFYLGYLVHLLTDILWHERKINPIKHLSNDEIKKIKAGWRSADESFLQRNSEFRPLIYLRDASGLERKWFDYYPEHMVKRLAEVVVNSSCSVNLSPYECDANIKEEINSFIFESSDYIFYKLDDLRGYYNIY